MWHSIFWLKQNFIHFSLYHALQQHKYKPTNFILFSNTPDLTYRNHKCKPIYTRKKKIERRHFQHKTSLFHTQWQCQASKTRLWRSFNFKHHANQKSQSFTLLNITKYNVGKKGILAKSSEQIQKFNDPIQETKDKWKKAKNTHKQIIFEFTYQMIPNDLWQSVDSQRHCHPHHGASQETSGCH